MKYKLCYDKQDDTVIKEELQHTSVYKSFVRGLTVLLVEQIGKKISLMSGPIGLGSILA